jgi:hypothetical protein
MWTAARCRTQRIGGAPRRSSRSIHRSRRFRRACKQVLPPSGRCHSQCRGRACPGRRIPTLPGRRRSLASRLARGRGCPASKARRLPPPIGGRTNRKDACRTPRPPPRSHSSGADRHRWRASPRHASSLRRWLPAARESLSRRSTRARRREPRRPGFRPRPQSAVPLEQLAVKWSQARTDPRSPAFSSRGQPSSQPRRTRDAWSRSSKAAPMSMRYRTLGITTFSARA